ncbi:MAG TPA: hypothetical protein VLH18_00340, partial [Candidatus Limnocylindrales bacterium]|nr:hypothetical protein [Candidatus Limnocylindrales bacterium]
AGVQGFYQVLFACRVRKVSQVKVLDLQPEKADQLCYRLREVLPQIRVKVVRTAEDLLEESQIVITATPSLKPVMPDNENLLRGKSYIAIGSYKPEMRELPEALYCLIDQILIDTEHGLEESGDLLTPLERGWIDRGRIVKFGSFLADREKSIGSSETTLFKSVGMALFDIVVAEKIYKKALEKGIGTCMD